MPTLRRSFLPELRDADHAIDYWQVPDRRDGSVYVLGDDLRLAIDVALVTARPLLLRGEPGSGKSSLAAFIARNLNWRYYEHVVSSRTTAQDLMWSFDSMRRLADASVRRGPDDPVVLGDAEYLEPGVMWWALDRTSALTRGRSAGQGSSAVRAAEEPFAQLNRERDPQCSVVLIDEIDKADPDVPNALLVPLGSTEFLVTPTRFLVRQQVTDSQDTPQRLIVITTNEERELPPAFLRRCIVHTLPEPNHDTLVTIARRHLSLAGSAVTDEEEQLLQQLAAKLLKLRDDVRGRGGRPPSTAEYLDAVHACLRLGIRVGDDTWQLVEPLVLDKHRQASSLAGR
jgi:MoxR-like ATPase